MFSQVYSGNVSGAYVDDYAWRYYITRVGQDNDSMDSLDLYRAPRADTHYYGIVAKDISDDLWQCMATVAVDNEAEVSRQLNFGWSILEVSQPSSSWQCLSLVVVILLLEPPSG